MVLLSHKRAQSSNTKYDDDLIKRLKYTGLEHRQPLRACDFHCDLQIEIENKKNDKILKFVKKN